MVPGYSLQLAALKICDLCFGALHQKIQVAVCTGAHCGERHEHAAARRNALKLLRTICRARQY